MKTDKVKEMSIKLSKLRKIINAEKETTEQTVEVINKQYVTESGKLLLKG